MEQNKNCSVAALHQWHYCGEVKAGLFAWEVFSRVARVAGAPGAGGGQAWMCGGAALDAAVANDRLET